MAKVVVNSTPLIALAKIGRLELLRDLYGEVRVPEAVWREVTAKDDDASASIRASADWVLVERCEAQPDMLSLMPARLHAGEVECIMLARQSGATYILLDDNAAKKTARFLGFRVMGTLGVLVTAKRLGLIGSVRPELDALRMVGFYASDHVVGLILRAAGE